jgi:hypothetical protein
LFSSIKIKRSQLLTARTDNSESSQIKPMSYRRVEMYNESL